MKVELSIKDDKELRDMIKDTIRGQIKSVIRSDIDEVIKEVVGNTAKLSDLLTKEISKVVKDFFSFSYLKGPGAQIVEKEIKEQVAIAFKKILKEN